MLELYYHIWVDLITRAKAQPENKYNWASRCMVYMSPAMIANSMLLMAVLQKKHILKSFFYTLDIPFLPQYLDNIATYIVLFVLPILVLNYVLIFRNRRYKKLQ